MLMPRYKAHSRLKAAAAIGTAALLILSAAAGGWLRRVGEKKFLELD